MARKTAARNTSRTKKKTAARKKKAPKKKAAAKKSARPRRKTATKKATAKKTPRKKAGKKVERLLPRPGEVIVRMYRQGLGDCFLLAFGTKKVADPRYILVDCGVHMRQTDGKDRLLQVMNHLKAATGGRLHVVVATHEHADHLSGFVQKQSPFLKDSLKIDQLWVGWTEKVGDAQADALRKKKGTARQLVEKAVREARQRAQRAGAAEQLGLNAFVTRLNGLMDFEAPDSESFDDDEDRDAVIEAIGKLAADETRKERKQLLETFLRHFLPDDTPDAAPAAAGPLGAAPAHQPRTRPSANELALGLLAMKADAVYCDPGDVLEIPHVENTRAYVLGPPRSEKLLKKDLPSKVRGGGAHDYVETYLSGQSSAMAFELSPAFGDSDDADKLYVDFYHPFAQSYRRTLEEHGASDRGTWGSDEESKVPDETREFFDQHYFHDDAQWRRVDADWLASAEQLALNLDSDTNNTSLVLAFELGPPGSGSILLFPGDAQVGNWLSWRSRKYTFADKTVTVDNLLERTLLYKVGHHGSHNATLKSYALPGSAADAEPYGLELMDNIIAMIPVDRAAADKAWPNPWRMPHAPLYTRLREKADRRVLRSDLSMAPLSTSEPKDLLPDSTSWKAVPGKPGLKWRKSAEKFAKGTDGPLYFDIRIPIPRRSGTSRRR